MKYPQNIQVQ